MKRTLIGLCALCLLITEAHAQRPLLDEVPTPSAPASSVGSLLSDSTISAPVAKQTARRVPVARNDDPESRPLSVASVSASTAKSAAPEAMMSDVTIKLGLVVGLMVLAGFAWRAFQTRRRSESTTAGVPTVRLELLEQVKLSPQQTLSVVSWGERRLLVGATASAVTLLAETSETVRTAVQPVSNPVAAPVYTPASNPVAAAAATSDRFEGILERLRAQEAEMLTEETSITALPFANEHPQPPRRSLFGGGRGQ